MNERAVTLERTTEAERLNSVNREIRQIDEQIASLRASRKLLWDQRCELEWGFRIGDKIRHKTKGTVGFVFDFETYWPRIKKLRKNGTLAESPSNAYYPEDWEKVIP